MPMGVIPQWVPCIHVCLRFRMAIEIGTAGGEHSKALVVCLLLRSLVMRQA